MTTDTPEAQVKKQLSYADLLASVNEGSDITPEDIADFQYHSGDEFLAALRERRNRLDSAFLLRRV